MKEPGHSQFSCFVIGEGALVIECCDLLLNRRHLVLGVAASNPEIIRWARERDIRSLDPGEDLVAAFKAVPFDYLFSIANMHIIPNEIFTLPRRFAINFHDGPLPRYAGVHATSWALIHQERHHAVSWHEVGDLVDGGRIFKQQPVAIAEAETAHSLNTKCFEAGMQSFGELVREIEDGRCQPRNQDLSQRTYFGMYERPPAACALLCSKPAAELVALVRRLQRLNPVSLPYLEPSGEETNGTRYAFRDMDAPESVLSWMRTHQAQLKPAECLLGVFAVYVARLTGESNFDLGLTLPELATAVAGLEGLFSPEVPLSVQIDGSADFASVAEAVLAQLEIARRYKTFSRDVLTRYPDLRPIADLGLPRLLRVSVHPGETVNGCPIQPTSDLCLLI